MIAARRQTTAVPVRVLLAEDNEADADLEVMELRRAGITVQERVVWEEAAYREALEHFEPDVILCDFAFPDFDGLTALKIAQSVSPDIPLIFVSGTLNEERLVIAVQHGAVDYVLKSNLLRLPNAVARALALAEEKLQRREAERRVGRLSRIRDVFAAVNSAIVRHRERKALFAEACRIVTAVGRFPFAMVLLRNEKTNVLEIVASDGLESGSKPNLRRLEASVASTLPAPLGTVGDVLERRAPVVVNELAGELSTGPRRVLWEAGVRSIGGFPLGDPDAIAGMILLATEDVGFFDEEEIALLTSISANLSFALDLLKEQERVGRLSRVRDILSAVNETIVRVDSAERLAHEVCRIAFETGSYVNVFAVAFDPKTDGVTVLAAFGPQAGRLADLQGRVQENVRENRGIIVRALRTAQPAFINDVGSSGDGALAWRLQGDTVRAIAAFPLKRDAGVAGAIVFDTAGSEHFDDQEIALLTNVADNLARALDHLDRQERLARLGRIREVRSAVNAAFLRASDRAELVQEVCRIAVEAGGFLNAYFFEFDGGGTGMRIGAFYGSSDRDELEETTVARFLDRERAPGVIATSIVTGRPVVKNGLPDGGRRGREGVHATGSFPVKIEELVIGAMVFETTVGDYFDDDETELLTSLTNNLAFALDLLEKRRRVTYLSLYDALTGLANRTLLFERLAQDLAEASRAGKMLGLVLLDISRFSVLNNTLGEHVGDEVLRLIARRLRDAVGEARIARLGADRFVLSFPMLDDVRALTEIVTEEGVKCLEAPFAVHDRELHIMARAGCAVFPNDGQGAEELMRNAEAALQKAKSTGAAYSFYAPELNARLARQLDLEARLQRAIEERQFVLYYQPKVDVVSREIVGFEALIRWRDPDRGLVPPGDFIPLLEQTGMIVPVGRWVLGEAARQYEEWKAAGVRPPRIAVNLSAVQLRQERLVDDVRAAVEGFSGECGLDAEVTESMLMENFDAAIAKLNAIRALGVNLSLDDFGTGYSSLSYIHRLPLNALKIDRSFILGMTEDPNKTSIVSTIISLGQALRLKIIAEGVEHDEEARLLLLLRCDQIQGYLFGKPEPAETAGALLARAHA